MKKINTGSSDFSDLRKENVIYVEIPPTKEHFNRARKVPVYDARIGATVKLVESKKGDRLEASYTLAADDLYVRARVESDAPTKFKRKRCLHPAHHTAWTQPYSLVESLKSEVLSLKS